MKKIKYLVLCTITNMALADSFTEKIPSYGVVKPAEMTTLLGINHGMVFKLPYSVGDKVKYGQVVLSTIEKETNRRYRTTISGKVAKLHVTQGAAVTPGMPLITIINDKKKKLELSLSPKEAQQVKVGAEVFKRGDSHVFGLIEKVSPLVDPDNGSVVSFVKPQNRISQLIGDILPLDISVRNIDGCKVVPLNQIDKHYEKYKLEATSGDMACLLPKK